MRRSAGLLTDQENIASALSTPRNTQMTFSELTSSVMKAEPFGLSTGIGIEPAQVLLSDNKHPSRHFTFTDAEPEEVGACADGPAESVCSVPRHVARRLHAVFQAAD